MKKNNAYVKDILRTIRRTKSRFFSIVGILALGGGFLAGISACPPTMRLRADTYYDETQFMDINVMSTLGLTDKDVEALEAIEGVDAVEAAQYTDREAMIDGEGALIRIHSLPEETNLLIVTEGRMPESEGECVIDIGEEEGNEVEIGDIITLTDSSDLTYDTYTIVGFVRDSRYLTFNFGTTEMGNGSLDYSVYIPIEDFTTDYYTEIRITVEGAAELNAFDEEYTELIDTVEARIEDIAADREQARYDAIVSEAQEELDDGWAEYEEEKADAEAEIADAEAEIAEAEAEIADGEAEIADAETELAEAEAELADGIAEIEENQQTLADGEAEYADGLQELEDQKEETYALLEEQWDEIEEAEATLASTKVELDEAYDELMTQYASIQEAAATLAETDETLTSAEEELAVQEVLLAETKAALDEAAAQIAAGETELSEAKAQLEALYAQIEALTEQIEALSSGAYSGSVTESETDDQTSEGTSTQIEALQGQLAVLMAAYESALSTYETAEAEFNSQKEQYEAGLSEYEAGLAAWEAAYAEVEAGRSAYEEGLAEYEAGLAEWQNGYAQYEEGLTAWEEGQAELEAGIVELEAAEAEAEEAFAEAEAELADARAELDDGYAQIEEALAEVEDAKAEIANGKAELEDAKAELEDGKAELEDAKAELEDAKAELEESLAEAEEELADAQKEIDEIEYPEWYVLTREENEGYVSMKNDSARIGAIASTLPWIFFAVAALVSLTSMTRMVEEERVLIGTYKALGYGKGQILMKYLIYAASACLLGCTIGIAALMKVFPLVVNTAYEAMYIIEAPIACPYYIHLVLLSVLLSLALTILVTVYSVLSTIRSKAAVLMMPAAPKAGKRILMEHIAPVWKRLKFLHKITARNLFRYKKRMIMTIVGVAGCTGLLVTGFGIKDSIQGILTKQYGEIYQYTLMIGIDTDEADLDSISAALEENFDSGFYQLQMTKMTDIKANGITDDIYLYIPESTDQVTSFISFQHRTDDGTVTFDEDSVILTEKLAENLGVSVGDTVSLKNTDGDFIDLTVTGITEHYVYDYVYISRTTYEEVMGDTWEANEIDMLSDDEDTMQLVADTIPGVTTIRSISEDLTYFEKMLDALNMVIIVIILAAGALAFIVLYNLTNINIMERRREIATIKVLGFYQNEVRSYIYRETAILTAIGCLVGLPVGVVIHHYIITTVEVDMVMFSRAINPISFVYAAIITAVFYVLVNLVMRKPLREVSMVESLKSVD